MKRGAFYYVIEQIAIYGIYQEEVWKKNESPWDCVIREVKEETGLDVEIFKLVGIYSKPDKDEVVFQFECKVLGGKITLNHEADQIEYFALKDIPNNFSPRQLERINDYLTNQKDPIMKIQH